jgi:hypothetical protein
LAPIPSKVVQNPDGSLPREGDSSRDERGTRVALHGFGARKQHRSARKETAMNAQKLASYASRIFVSLTIITALSALSGCVVYGRPAPRYYRYYR